MDTLARACCVVHPLSPTSAPAWAFLVDPVPAYPVPVWSASPHASHINLLTPAAAPPPDQRAAGQAADGPVPPLPLHTPSVCTCTRPSHARAPRHASASTR
jgi:hypothetical protein